MTITITTNPPFSRGGVAWAAASQAKYPLEFWREIWYNMRISLRKGKEDMPPIETIARPRRNRISVAVPSEYSSCSFKVILVPLEPSPAPAAFASCRSARRRKNFVETLLSCPRLADGETLDVARDALDYGRDVAL